MAVSAAQSKEADRAPLDLTSRRDNWWLRPLVTVLVLGAFVIYSTWRALVGQDTAQVGPYLSPFYSPLLGIHLSIFGWAISPALYILIFPLSFRLTCYYYRLAYYRSFFLDPPACAVSEPIARKHYTGEQRFPLILQNIHRYAFYAAAVFVVILAIDAIQAFFFADGFHVNLGSLVLTLNVVLIALYTFSCHSWRHLIGGRINCYSCSIANRTRYGLWKRFTFLNERHALYAWSSLIMVALADLYIWLLASGAIQDPRFF
ncbi:MAG: succinate dehydrogenase [Chloroflexia bacterium]